jgi:predicted CoA-binding protein
MNLKQIMQKQNFAVVGNTLNPEKYAYKIKEELLRKGYCVSAVGKELASLNDVAGRIDIIDLCINPVKGLALMKECKKTFDCIVIQPGAESAELFAYLDENNLPYIEGCLFVGLALYAR